MAITASAASKKRRPCRNGAACHMRKLCSNQNTPGLIAAKRIPGKASSNYLNQI